MKHGFVKVAAVNCDIHVADVDYNTDQICRLIDPAKHLSTLCNQMVNFLGIMQNEWAGAQAFSSSKYDILISVTIFVGKLINQTAILSIKRKDEHHTWDSSATQKNS